MPTKKKAKVNPDPTCKSPENPSCPYHSGVDSPYRYQLGCRGEACKTANREYYKKWRAAKQTSNGKVPVKKAKAVKKVAKKAAKKSK